MRRRRMRRGMRRAAVLLSVLAQVTQHAALLHERLAAARTRVRSLAAVRPPVRDQVALAHEVLVAQVAAEWTVGI